MPASNLSKIFGPTIVGYSNPDPEPDEMMIETMQQAKVRKDCAESITGSTKLSCCHKMHVQLCYIRKQQ
jgi:hypothetical protein